MQQLNRRLGFTLIELMIVVAIIAILAAVAIPNFQRYQLRSRRAEGELVLNGVLKAQKSSFADQNKYYATAPCPGNDLAAADTGQKKARCAWNDGNISVTNGWERIGYSADEYVYCSWACVSSGGANDMDEGADAICGGLCDIDDDNKLSVFAVTIPAFDGASASSAADLKPDGTNGIAAACSPDSANRMYDSRDGQHKSDTAVRCSGDYLF